MRYCLVTTADFAINLPEHNVYQKTTWSGEFYDEALQLHCRLCSHPAANLLLLPAYNGTILIRCSAVSWSCFNSDCLFVLLLKVLTSHLED